MRDGTTPQDPWSGKVLASQFRIEERLGRGGMGVVYRATQLGMNRAAVIKVMHRELTANATAVERFKREAQAVGQLNHPHIVQVYMFGEAEEGSLYIAMEYIPGQSLGDALRAGEALHESRALRIVDGILSALVEAHGVGIIHRDLKPDNVMLTERQGSRDYVKVLDFGLAKLFGETHGDETLTQAGMVTGTPRYMSPEQARGLKLDARTDIYSLGVILYELLTGLHPFDAESALDYMHKHTTEAVPRPHERCRGLQLMPRCEALVMKCLAKQASDRFQSAREMQREVRRVLRDFPDASREFPTPARTTAGAQAETRAGAVPVRRTGKRRPGLAWAVGGVALVTTLLVAALGGLYLHVSGQQKEKSASARVEVVKTAGFAEEGAPDVRPAAPDTSSPPVLRKEVERRARREAEDSPEAIRAEIDRAVAEALAREGLAMPQPQPEGAKPPGGTPEPVVEEPPVVAPDPVVAPEMPVDGPLPRPGPSVVPLPEGGREALRTAAFSGVPVADPDATLVSRMNMALNYGTDLDEEAVMAYYLEWCAGRRKHRCRRHGQVLNVQGEGTAVKTVVYNEHGGLAGGKAAMVIVALDDKEKNMPERTDRGVLGEPLPGRVEISMVAAQVVGYHTEMPVKAVAAYYDEQYDGVEGVQVTRSAGFGAMQYVAMFSDEGVPYVTITVMRDHARHKGTQILVTSREAMAESGY